MTSQTVLPPERIRELRASHYNAEVSEIRLIHEELALFRVRPDGDLPVHLPGQYLTLGLGLWESRVAGIASDLGPEDNVEKLLRRAYSISHPMLDTNNNLVAQGSMDFLEFYIVLVRKSERGTPSGLTPRLFALTTGNRLHLGEKAAGRYTLAPVAANADVLFLATGTGEAPHNYMLWQLLVSGHRGRICSVSCVRKRNDLAYLAVHQELMRRYPNYRYVALTTREPQNQGKKTYIQDLLVAPDFESQTGLGLDPTNTHVYLCGNPKMIGVPQIDRQSGSRQYPQELGCVEILERRGFVADFPAIRQVGNIHFEQYW